MGERTAAARAQAIEGFAAALSQLRDGAGTPPFRTMAGRSHAISHTTLHEAVKGNRLPSWSTTVEFVKACGGDPADYRERWERASAAVSCAPAGATSAVPARVAAATARVPAQARVSASVDATEQPSPPQQPVVAVVPVDEPRDVTPPAPDDDDRPPSVARPRSLVLAGVLVTVVVLAVGAGVSWSLTHRAHASAPSPSGPRAADCPIKQHNPPPAPPQHTGDRAAYVADVTLPDCTHVARATTVTKVWRLKNAGAVPWVGYSLHRIDLPQRRDQCQTITDVAVPTTRPGKLVDITVEVATPPASGFCFVRFKMVDADGQVAFPGSRPVNFQVVVD